MSEGTQQPRRGDVFIVTLLFAVFFGYSLFMAWGNFQSLPELYDAIGAADSTPWAVLVVGMIVPPALFAGAMALGRERQLVARAGILLAALAVNAQIALLLEAIARQVAVTVLSQP